MHVAFESLDFMAQLATLAPAGIPHLEPVTIGLMVSPNANKWMPYVEDLKWLPGSPSIGLPVGPSYVTAQ